MNTTYEITSGTGEVVATVFVSAEDVAERGEPAEVIFEERYESALANVGLTYDDALAGRFSFRVAA